MVAFFCPPPFLAGVEPFSASFLQFTSTGNSFGSSFTIPDVNIGTPSSSRIVLIAVHHYLAGATDSALLSTASIGGVPATIIQNVMGRNLGLAMIFAKVPLGGAATVALTFTRNVSATALRLATYRISGAKSDLPHSSAGNGGATTTRTATIETPDGGVAIVANMNFAIGTITNIPTLNYTYQGGDGDSGIGGHVIPTNLSPSASYSSAGRAIIAVSWR